MYAALNAASANPYSPDTARHKMNHCGQARLRRARQKDGG